jgi:hypothetical protein
MDERIKNHTRARRQGMRSRALAASPAHVQVDASHPGRATLRLYRCAPMKDLKSRIIAFSFAILVSLAAWGGFVYIAMHLIKK